MIRRRNLLLASVAFCGLSSAFIIHNSDQDLFEVIVVGGGSAGLAAAVSAAERGLKVLVIEKRHRVGLNTHSDRGLFASSQSPTGEPSFNDSVENHYKNSFEAGGSLADPSVLMSFVSQAPETLKWLSSLGMSFDDSAINSNSLWRRCYQPLQTGYTETLYREAVRLGVKFVFNAALIDLKENKGRIDSVEVAQKNGQRKIYTATLGVVLCSGGFGANLKMVAELAPKYAGLESDNEPGASGEVLLIAKKKGAATSGLDRILCLPRPSGAFKSQGYLHLDISKFIFINSQGKRFVSEDALRPEITEAFFREGFKPIYELADDNAVKDYQMDIQRDLWRGIEHGTVFKGKTLGELAAKLSMPEENLITTVA